MRDGLTRLRAALTPQTLLLLAAALLLLGGGLSAGMQHEGGAQTQLEKRIGETLSAVTGAGRVEVVIKLQQAGGHSASAAQDAQQIPVGVIAVAQGADDPLVKLELQEALCTLLGLPVSAVSVVAGGG